MPWGFKSLFAHQRNYYKFMTKLFTPVKNWSLDVTKMQPATRWLFAAALIIVPIMGLFLLGLAIDWLLREYAKFAYVGIGLGIICSLTLLVWQGRKMLYVDNNCNNSAKTLPKKDKAANIAKTTKTAKVAKVTKPVKATKVVKSN